MKNRKVTSFEPDTDVSELLKRGKAAGLTIGDVCNLALKKYGRTVIKELARERKTQSEKIIASFNAASGQPPELELLAA